MDALEFLIRKEARDTTPKISDQQVEQIRESVSELIQLEDRNTITPEKIKEIVRDVVRSAQGRLLS